MQPERRFREVAMKALARVGLHPWLTCRECVEYASDYLEGELTPRAQAAVLGHLDHCPECVRYFRQIELTVRLAKRITPGSSLHARAALLEAFRAERATPPTQ